MARALNLSPATMTVTLKRMEKAGLVLREMDEHDQRILRVHLSEKGREMCETGESRIGVVTAELLEENGIVGPFAGSNPREVLPADEPDDVEGSDDE